MFLAILCVSILARAGQEASFRSLQSVQIENSLLWGTFGDALGAPIEFAGEIGKILQTPGFEKDFLIDNFKSVINYSKIYYSNRFEYVPYTDDTRMTLLVFQELLKIYNNLEVHKFLSNTGDTAVLFRVAMAFKKDFKDMMYGWAAAYRAPGVSTMNAISALPKNPKTVQEILLPRLTFEDPGNDRVGGGCGSVMHAAPFGYFPDFWKYSGEHSKITHNHPIAIASCASLARGIDLMINQKGWKKDDIIQEMIKVADEFERTSILQDDIENNRYTFRMRTILETALNAAKEMAATRETFAKKQSSNPFLIPFHDLMQDDTFKKEHIKMFPKAVSSDYAYDTPEFIGWDAATCLAAAMYNFCLWIPENINDLDEQERMRCLTNAITSAMIIGGDSDSVTSITGQLCGAYVSKLTIASSLKGIIEGSDVICAYAQNIK